MIELLALRLVHVVAGLLWVGAGFFNALVLAPVLSQPGPGAGPVMACLKRRGLFVFRPTMTRLTIVSGVRLMCLTSGGTAAYLRSPGGAVYTAASVVAIVVFVLGMTVMGPAGRRMGALAAELAGAQDDERRSSLRARLTALQRTNRQMGLALTVLMLVSAAGMAVGRYL